MTEEQLPDHLDKENPARLAAMSQQHKTRLQAGFVLLGPTILLSCGGYKVIFAR